MIQTDGTGINGEQFETLQECFNKNKQLYNSDIKAEKNEFRSIMILIGIGIFAFLPFLFFEDGTGERPIDNIMTLLFLCGSFFLLFAMIWGMSRSAKHPYKNQKGLIEILERFKSLSVRGEIKNSDTNDFYSTAVNKKILNGSPDNIKIDVINKNDFILESSDIYTSIPFGRYSQIVDDCILSRISYKNKGLMPAFSIQRDTTNNIVMILRRLLSSIGWGLVLCILYYIFIIEKCDYNSLDGGCDNRIKLFGFFSPIYAIYTFIIGFVFFAFGYIKTLIQKNNGPQGSGDNDFDIFIHKGSISDIPSGYLKEIKIFFQKHSNFSNNCKLFINENCIYINLNRNIVSHHNNSIVFLYQTIVRGISKNSSEKDFVKKYVKYINFIDSACILGDKLKKYYR